MTDRFRELSDLLSALCDQRLTESDRARLESLVLGDREALQWYLRFVQLHGLLHWDAAGGAIEATLFAEPLRRQVPRQYRRTLVRRGALAAAAVAICMLVGWRATREDPHSPIRPVVIAPPSPGAVEPPVIDGSDRPNPTVRLPGTPSVAAVDVAPGAPHEASQPASPALPVATSPNRSSESMVAAIDAALAAHWREHEVTPAAEASDAAWLRRVHLDLVGRIPEVEAVVTFLDDRRADKRARVVDDLLTSPEFARHYSVVWTNLLIGHTAPREVNRPALEKFLREQFHRNRPWSETVGRLVSAEGYEDEDGAANFLLAHLNNEAVPATAVTARVLLCEQLQCTQCHDHPFVGWSQDRFWQLNAFFQQTEIKRHPRTDPQSGRRMRDRLELVSLETGGPTFFEDRQSRMKAVYPQFGGVDVNARSDVHRRDELARLLSAGENPQVARAFVNRLWSKLFGFGFTTPVDDMGPHNQPVMPELLDALSAEFVRSGFDVKRLVRWVCLSRAYQLSHEGSPSSTADAPAAGSPPLFSRAYIRPLSAEQLFDSLLTATQADRAGARYWDEVEARRRAWLEQFYTALDNDENSEEDAFEGSLEQTLVLMNGDLIRQALSAAPGTVLQQILARDLPDDERIRLLSLATLSRAPTAAELAGLRRALRQQVQSRPRDVSSQTAHQEALRDLMWAYLNSTEFRSNL